jgi:hypothetical protein
MSYQPRNSTAPESTASTIILAWALTVAFGFAPVLIAASIDSTLLRWMCGCR